MRTSSARFARAGRLERNCGAGCWSVIAAPPVCQGAHHPLRNDLAVVRSCSPESRLHRDRRLSARAECRCGSDRDSGFVGPPPVGFVASIRRGSHLNHPGRPLPPTGNADAHRTPLRRARRGYSAARTTAACRFSYGTAPLNATDSASGRSARRISVSGTPLMPSLLACCSSSSTCCV